MRAIFVGEGYLMDFDGDWLVFNDEF